MVSYSEQQLREIYVRERKRRAYNRYDRKRRNRVRTYRAAYHQIVSVRIKAAVRRRIQYISAKFHSGDSRPFHTYGLHVPVDDNDILVRWCLAEAQRQGFKLNQIVKGLSLRRIHPGIGLIVGNLQLSIKQ